MHQARRVVAVATAVALLLTGCSGLPAGPRPGPTATDHPVTKSVETLRRTPFSQASVDAFAGVLTAAGVEIAAPRTPSSG